MTDTALTAKVRLRVEGVDDNIFKQISDFGYRVTARKASEASIPEGRRRTSPADISFKDFLPELLKEMLMEKACRCDARCLVPGCLAREHR